jgi:hypothetical protein
MCNLLLVYLSFDVGSLSAFGENALLSTTWCGSRIPLTRGLSANASHGRCSPPVILPTHGSSTDTGWPTHCPDANACHHWFTPSVILPVLNNHFLILPSSVSSSFPQSLTSFLPSSQSTDYSSLSLWPSADITSTITVSSLRCWATPRSSHNGCW